MSEHGRLRDPDLAQRGLDQLCLRLRSPDRATGPLAMAIPRAVERNHAVRLGGRFDQAARREVLDHAAVAVQEDQRLSFSLLDVVQANSVDLDELARRAGCGAPQRRLAGGSRKP